MAFGYLIDNPELSFPIFNFRVNMSMKKDDIHVLDWSKILQGSTAKRACDNKGKGDSRTVNKGILFEDMIEKLLMAMFPNEVWKRTDESHDGKRDFVYPAEDYLREQKWAECKNYSSSLSINVIAPTLIMGAIENIEYIFFFSYSPLNDNAIEGLLRYSDIEKRDVKIYDGNLLESLICRYHAMNGIGAFFPDTDFDKAYAALKKKRIRVIKLLQDLNGNRISSTHTFELGELFNIRIMIQNLTWEPIDCKISFQVGNQTSLRHEAGEQGFSISFAKIEEYPVLCEALCPGTSNCVVKIADQVSRKEIKRVPQKIKIIDEPYLAWSGENALHARDQGLKHLAERRNSPLLIAGGSGTGKSTLIEIMLRDECIRQYRVLRIDLNLSRDNCARNLFSQIIGVRTKEETPREQMEEDGALSLLLDSYTMSASVIAETIMKFHDPAVPYLFVIDDVQKIGRPYISMLQELEDRAKKDGAQIYYILALNEDKATLDELLASLNWDANFQNRECEVVQLTKFGKKDILTYMKTRYGLEGIDDCFEGFESQLSPLEIHSFCVGLKKERVMIQVPNAQTYQIVDRFEFVKGIKHTLYASRSLNRICESLDKAGSSAYILKYLYITGKVSASIAQRYPKLLQGLMEQSILKDKNGTVTFYHDEIRAVIGRTLSFSMEDYIDIFDDPDTDDGSKAICALMQIGQIKKSPDFLKDFFNAAYKIETISQRYDLCQYVFQQLDKLCAFNLTSDALQFVRCNFKYLNEEQGHAAFFSFLNCIADSALRCDWDTDERSAENMAYFIKKFFDRALSTYNNQSCISYFQKFVKIFQSLKHISDSRRNFWLSHYANRAAIALDRDSVPLTEEPVDASTLYDQSLLYCTQAGSPNELMLQIAVDNFNRHYVYRHDLTADIIRNTYKQLLDIKRDGLSEPMVLDYHLLLLKYLQYQADARRGVNLSDLLEQVGETRKRCTSAFYTLKLYTLEIHILVNLGHFAKAAAVLPHAFEFAYKKEMRSSVYKLTYIQAHLMIFENGFVISSEAYQQIVLALEQIMDTHGNAANNLKREIFLLVQLAKTIAKHEEGRLADLVGHQVSDTRELLRALYMYISDGRSEMEDLFEMQSYFVVKGVSFPTI